jgi:tRNA pseudouridine32 synthase/23S rRNA pseudouridine746 synthase
VTPRIVFSDADVLVVDKPSGMPSVHARTPLDPPDVARQLTAAHGPLEAAHRLDRDTSGLLVLARSRAARSALGRAFEQRLVRKRYLTVVLGIPAGPGGTIKLPLGPDRDHPPRHHVDHDSGKAAATRWQFLATVAEPAMSLLAVEPLTGRSHQIRVHLAAIGLPIVGDRLYLPSDQPESERWCGQPAAGGDDSGDMAQGRSEAGRPTLALHACGLDLPHPASGAPLSLAAAPPDSAVWRRFATAVTAALAAWPIASPSASSGKIGPDH